MGMIISLYVHLKENTRMFSEKVDLSVSYINPRPTFLPVLRGQFQLIDSSAAISSQAAYSELRKSIYYSYGHYCLIFQVCKLR